MTPLFSAHLEMGEGRYNTAHKSDQHASIIRPFISIREPANVKYRKLFVSRNKTRFSVIDKCPFSFQGCYARFGSSAEVFNHSSSMFDWKCIAGTEPDGKPKFQR
jgi:hypothetical protein